MRLRTIDLNRPGFPCRDAAYKPEGSSVFGGQNSEVSLGDRIHFPGMRFDVRVQADKATIH
jgi:hypothetical protein